MTNTERIILLLASVSRFISESTPRVIYFDFIAASKTVLMMRQTRKRKQKQKSSDMHSAIFLIRNNETKMNYDIRKSTQMLWKRIEL